MGRLVLRSRHRLLCGDSTKAEDVERVMGGCRADVYFSSPPYNLGSSSKLSGNSSQEIRGNAYIGHDDAMTPESWASMLSRMVDAVKDRVDCVVVNVQPLAGNKASIWSWIASIGDRLVDVLVWDKGHAAPNIARGVVSAAYELIVVIGKKSASRSIPVSCWRGTIQSVYRGPKQTSNEFASIHGATFPVHLPAFIISDLCDKSESVVDGCLGSGTTLVAAEQLGRRCYGLEIEPAYCDVVVQRFEALTGEKAVRWDG